MAGRVAVRGGCRRMETGGMEISVRVSSFDEIFGVFCPFWCGFLPGEGERRGSESSWRRRWRARRIGKAKGRAGIENGFSIKREH